MGGLHFASCGAGQNLVWLEPLPHTHPHSYLITTCTLLYLDFYSCHSHPSSSLILSSHPSRLIHEASTPYSITLIIPHSLPLTHHYSSLTHHPHPSLLTPHPLLHHPYYPSFLTPHPSLLIRHPSPLSLEITPRSSPLTPHPSPLTPHSSPLIPHLPTSLLQCRAIATCSHMVGETHQGVLYTCMYYTATCMYCMY